VVRTVYRCIVAWLGDEKGQDLMEYGLLAVLIGVALVALLPLVASQVSRLFSNVISAFGQ
jgi:Flp pilus assembly pilin Flp